MPKVLYWSGISRANLEFFYRCEDKINLLLAGFTKSADLDLKKAHGHRLYTIRLNLSDRLLFTTVINEGKSYLLLLDLIENHDYQKSRFLKPGVLARFLVDKARDIEQVINADDFKVITGLDGEFIEGPSVEATSAASCGLNYQKVTYYNQQFITLDTTQLMASDSQLPMIVSGPPGSGKSCVALSLISKEVSKRVADDAREIVCVTMSRRLSNHLQAQWQELPEARDETGNLLDWVRFITYNQLLVQQPFIIPEGQLVERTYFNEWFTNYKKEITDTIKLLDEPLKQAASELIASNTDKIFQEFCIIAVNPAEYFDLGVRQSLFYGKNEREMLLAAYQMYCRYLIISNRVCPFLYQPEIREPLFGCVIVDEAQDFSLGQLLNLSKLTDNVNIAFSLDSHQSLLASKSIRPRLVQKLTQLVQAQHLYVTEIALQDTYRCPTVVAKLANQVLAIKNHITGGVGDKEEIAQIMPSTKAGCVYWQDSIPDSCDAFTSYFKRLQHELNVNEAQIAIITPQELIETVQRITEHPLVFSPSDIKGLEYSGIIAWSPLDHPDVVEANKYLPDEGEELNVSTHRSKDKESNLDGLAPVLNGVFVTLTRALVGLFILQPYSHNKRRVIGQLKQALSLASHLEERPQPDIGEIPITAPETSKADWKKECIRLWQNDNLAQAQKIYERYLAEHGKTLEQYMQEYEQKRDSRATAASETISTAAEKGKKADVAKQKTVKAQIVPAGDFTASEPITCQPLSTKLSNWVEGLFKVISHKSNLLLLLKHEKLIPILFHHKMANGHCLFVNICATENFSLFINNLKQLKSTAPKEVDNFIKALNVAYQIAQQTSDVHLKLFLGLVKFDAITQPSTVVSSAKKGKDKKAQEISIPPLAVMINDIREQQFCSLFDSDDGAVVEATLNLITRCWASVFPLLTYEDMVSQKRWRDGSLTPSFLHSLVELDCIDFLDLRWADLKSSVCRYIKDTNTNGEESFFYFLLHTPEGRAFPFLNKHWVDFKPYINKSILSVQETDEISSKGANSFYWLCYFKQGRELLTKHWNDFRPFIDNLILAAQLVNDGPSGKGTSPFYWLCSTPEGRALLNERWADFKPHIDELMLSAEVAWDSDYKGPINPFYALCCTPEGQALLKNRWLDFKLLVNKTTLLTPKIGKVFYKGSSLFYCLCFFSEGRALLNAYWSDFKSCVSREVLGYTTDGGTGPLYFLCGNLEGRQLLMKHWCDFKPHLDKSFFAARAMDEGPDKGTSPFYFLCGALDGIQLLTTYWKDFKLFIDRAVLSAQALAGANKGTSPFYNLCDIEEGRALLSQHWENFKPFIDKPMLSARVTANYSDEKGKSPFYLLCSSPDGRIILNQHWADFRRHIDKSMLAACVSADNSADKGKNALYYLCNTPDEQNLLLEHWADFRTLIDSPMLAAQATNGAFQGISAFYALCSNAEGKVLLKSHWNDFRPLLTKAMLSAQITGNDPERGISPFYCLCNGLDGQELLLAHWPDFKPLIDEQMLTAKITGDGAWKGTTPFYSLCSGSKKGQKLIVDHWDDFKMLIEKTAVHFPFEERNPKGNKTLLQQILSLLPNKIMLDDVTEHSIIKKAFIYEHDKKFIDSFYIRCLRYYQETLKGRLAAQTHSYLPAPAASQLVATVNAVNMLLESIIKPKETRFDETYIPVLKQGKCWGIICAYASASNITVDRLLADLSQSSGLAATQSKTKTESAPDQVGMREGSADAQCRLGDKYASGQGVVQNYSEARRLYQLAANRGHTDAQYKLGEMYINGQGGPQNYSEAVRLFKLAAQQGHSDAQCNLGKMYTCGRCLPQNLSEALSLFKLAAKKGHAPAQFNLGEAYREGLGVAQNQTEAVRLYKLAAAQGYADAQCNLANMYSTGTGVTQSHTEAIRLYRLASEQGHADALYNLGNIYYNGYGIVQNYCESLRLYQLAAKQGHAGAQYNLGVAYLNGQGIAQNITEAVRLFKLAAEQNYAEAQCNLGALYISGRGVVRNIAEGIRLYKLAVIQGLAGAQFNLGELYANGIGVRQNDAEAVRLFRLAAEKGHAEAQCILGTMYVSGKGVRQNDAEAVRLFRLAVAQGHVASQYNLGVMYKNGQGVEQDDVEAARLYQLAANQGHAKAQCNLGAMYANGQGVTQNFTKAIYLLKLAAEQGHTQAQYNLGVRYEQGLGVEQNIVESLRLFRLAASQEHIDSLYYLGVMYEQGKGVEQNDTEALRLFRLASKQGHALAHFNVGVMYQYGRGGLKIDIQEAVRLFKLAAEQGVKEAQYIVGIRCAIGDGVVQNIAEAVRLLKLAAERGHAQAQYELAGMYERGIAGLDIDLDEAVRLYQLAAEQDHAEAQSKLEEMRADAKKSHCSLM